MENNGLTQINSADKIDRIINSLDNNNPIYKLVLIFRLIRISVVTFIVLRFIDKIFEKARDNPVTTALELMIDVIISLIYSARVNHIIEQLLA